MSFSMAAVEIRATEVYNYHCMFFDYKYTRTVDTFLMKYLSASCAQQ